MSDIAKKAVICIATLAFSLSAIAGPLEAVLCLGSHGHIAVEAPHDTCTARPCHEDAHEAPAPAISDADGSADHNDCTCCIDIPLPGGRMHFYTDAFDKDVFDCLPTPHHNSETLHTFSSQNQAIVFWQTPGPPANGLSTIILLI
jgi:hypothetical protein